MMLSDISQAQKAKSHMFSIYFPKMMMMIIGYECKSGKSGMNQQEQQEERRG
jgi:hypothetical protein